MTHINIIIADDHPIFRKGLRQIVEESGALKVIAEAPDGEAAVKLVGELNPSVVVLDLDMPKMNGLEAARAIAKQKRAPGIIILTMHKEEDLFDEAMDSGIIGYVLKENAASEIVSAIESVAAGKHYLSPSLSGFLVSRSNRARTLEQQRPGLQQLTPMERRILAMVALNKTSKEIAEELSISYKTVENHRTNIAGKLDLKGSHALLKFALENKSLL